MIIYKYISIICVIIYTRNIILYYTSYYVTYLFVIIDVFWNVYYVWVVCA